MSELAIVILAAGHGTRMQSKKNKVLLEVGGSPMVEHAVDSAITVSDMPPVVVVSPRDSEIRSLLGHRVVYVEQAEQLGTGHAVMMARAALLGRAEQVLVTYADMPLLSSETLSSLAKEQKIKEAAVVLLVVEGDKSSTFGRVIKDSEGRVVEIVEVAEAMRRPNKEELLDVCDHNAGVYCFDANWLWANIGDLPIRQARDNQEYYLTDMVGLAVSQEKLVVAIKARDPEECLGAGTREELAIVEQAFRRRTNQMWMNGGVTIEDSESTYIDRKVRIGNDTIIRPNTHLKGSTSIGDMCTIGPNSVIRDSLVGNRCRIEQTVVEDTTIADGTVIEPFSHIKG